MKKLFVILISLLLLTFIGCKREPVLHLYDALLNSKLIRITLRCTRPSVFYIHHKQQEEEF